MDFNSGWLGHGISRCVRNGISNILSSPVLWKCRPVCVWPFSLTLIPGGRLPGSQVLNSDFSGHCWSNESHYPALDPKDETGTNLSSSVPSANTSRLHPSFAPKCTHAYALSRSGARRLLLHLRYPPFAYSRALDQAFAWLVQSGRIRAYSVVPSVVVQRKVGGSDVTYGQEGMGSGWREGLLRGVFSA